MIREKHKVLIADDHTVIRRGIALILNTQFKVQGVFECEEAGKIIQSIEENKITHAILDVTFPDQSSIFYLDQILTQFPELKILLFTMHPKALFQNTFSKYKQILYCQKNESEQQFTRMLKKLFSNEISPNNIPKRKEKSKDFSAMEEKVLLLLLGGASTKEISEKLNIKSNTVSTYKRRIFDKKEVQNLMELSKLY